MNTAEQILVVILASVLALFLLLAIIAIVLVIKIVGNVRHITSKAEHVIDSVESVGDVLRRAAGPVSILQFVRGVAETVMQHKKDDKRSKHDQ